MTPTPETTMVHAHVMGEWLKELKGIAEMYNIDFNEERIKSLLTTIYSLGVEDGERIAYAKRNI